MPPLSLIALCLLICFPLLIHICVLGAPFLPLDICQYGLDLSGPSLSSEVGAGDSLEKQTFKLNEGEHRLLYNSPGPPVEDPLCSRVTV